jgi:hypothetical protein
MCPKDTNMKLFFVVLDHIFHRQIETIREDIRFILTSIKY